MMRRHFCESCSCHCGSCLSPLEENEDGHCVVPRGHNHGMKAFTHPPHPPSGYCVTIYLAPIVWSGLCFSACASTNSNCESGNTQSFSQAECCAFINQTRGLWLMLSWKRRWCWWFRPQILPSSGLCFSSRFSPLSLFLLVLWWA